MAWNLSTGAKKALLGVAPTSLLNYAADTISFGDGDGAGGTDTINDSASGFTFKKHAYILILNSTNNDNVLVKALTVTSSKIEVEAGSFTAESAGANICLAQLKTGSLREVFKNSVIRVFTGSRPADADTTESGTQLLELSLNGDSFTAGDPTNGLNFGTFSGTTLKRATDPETSATEVWKDDGMADGTAGWARWYDNSLTTGASTTAIRMDGVVATSGGDLNLSNGTTITSGVASQVTDVNFTVTMS